MCRCERAGCSGGGMALGRSRLGAQLPSVPWDLTVWPIPVGWILADPQAPQVECLTCGESSYWNSTKGKDHVRRVGAGGHPLDQDQSVSCYSRKSKAKPGSKLRRRCLFKRRDGGQAGMAYLQLLEGQWWSILGGGRSFVSLGAGGRYLQSRETVLLPLQSRDLWEYWFQCILSRSSL